MAECPFCGSNVDEDLVIYGGPCPKCFAEIPGEEAPTDPGAEARAAQEKKDRRGATLRAAIGLGAMMALVGCAGIAAVAVVLWPEPEVAVMDFDSAEFDYPVIELTGGLPEGQEQSMEDPAPEAEGGKPAPKGPAPKRPNVDGYAGVGLDDGAAKAGEALGTDDGVAAVDRPRGTRGSDGPVAGPAGLDDLGGTNSQKGSAFDLDLGVKVDRRGEVLSDPDQIRQMIGKLMQRQVGRLTQCYERSLKRDPKLGGRWLIKYTVSKDGKAVEATATGRDVAAPEMEECIANVIESKWRFDRITRAQPVQKTLTFRPG